MEIQDLIERQREFDERHGWSTSYTDPSQQLNALAKDVIGLFGESGEIANVLKKIQLHQNQEELEHVFAQHREAMKEEVVDTLIYLIRIASHLDMDVTTEYMKKLSSNEEKYRWFECQKLDTKE